MAHHPTYQQSPNTKTEAGKMLETWLKLDMLMVQSHQDLSQWLLVVHQVMDQRKFISERNYSIILIFQVQIRSCGISALWKVKSSMQHYQAITHSVLPCSLLMRNTAAKIRSRKFMKKYRETASLNFDSNKYR